MSFMFSIKCLLTGMLQPPLWSIIISAPLFSSSPLVRLSFSDSCICAVIHDRAPIIASLTLRVVTPFVLALFEGDQPVLHFFVRDISVRVFDLWLFYLRSPLFGEGRKVRRKYALRRLLHQLFHVFSMEIEVAPVGFCVARRFPLFYQVVRIVVKAGSVQSLERDFCLIVNFAPKL